MTDQLTSTPDLDLTPIEARVNAATPGPWNWSWADDLTSVPTKRWTKDSYTVEPAVCATSRFKQGYGDAALIAHSSPVEWGAVLPALKAARALLAATRDYELLRLDDDATGEVEEAEVILVGAHLRAIYAANEPLAVALDAVEAL